MQTVSSLERGADKLEFSETGELFQGITFSTRFRTGTPPSGLGLVFFSVRDAFSQASTLSPIGLSDHAVVKFLLKWRTPTSNAMFRPRRWSNYKLLNPKNSSGVKLLETLALRYDGPT